MDLVIVTGMSGAGKTVAMHAFEDMGYYCVDNLPPQLLPKFIELCEQSTRVERVAAVVDIRGGHFFDQMEEFVTSLAHPAQILFLEANSETLVRRFKESRRDHPLSGGATISQGIALEGKRLEPLRSRADYIIDTSRMSAADLRKKLFSLFTSSGPGKTLNISVVSFGFKYGLPLDADLVFDVRFLPNPHYEEALRELTGQQQAVRDYVLGWTVTQQFIKKLKDFLEFLIPCYIKEGKTQLTVAIGCTGGKHRSVTLANLFCAFLQELGQNAVAVHRDIEKD